MASVVKIKRSAVAQKRPTTSNIETGELALNTADGRLFSSNGTEVFEIGANVHSLSVGAGTFSIANGAITFPSSDGTTGQVLVTDGSGTVSFGSAAGAIGSAFVANTYFQPILANTNAAIADRMQVANTVLLVNDRLQVANADALYVSMSGDTMTGPLDFDDNVRARFGTGDDLQIYHSGTENVIVGTGTYGEIKIQSSAVKIVDNGGNLQADFSSNGAETRLFYQGNEKLATKTGGIDVTGDITVSGTVDGVDIAALSVAVDDRMQVANVIAYTAKYLEVANSATIGEVSNTYLTSTYTSNTAFQAYIANTEPRLESLESAVTNNNLSGFPFYKSDGSQDNIHSTNGGEFPFYVSDGTQDNIIVSF